MKRYELNEIVTINGTEFKVVETNMDGVNNRFTIGVVSTDTVPEGFKPKT